MLCLVVANSINHYHFRTIYSAGQTHRNPDALEATIFTTSNGCSLYMVETWIHRFEEAEAKGVHANFAVVDQPHPGREPKITESIGKAILKEK